MNFNGLFLIVVTWVVLLSGSALAKVLLLHGGFVSESHQYFQTSVNLLARQGIDYDLAPVARMTDAWLASKNYDAIIVSDYSALTSATTARKAIADFGVKHQVGIVFTYVEAGVFIPEAGLATTGFIVAPKLRSGTSQALQLLRDSTNLTENSPLSTRAFAGANAEQSLIFALHKGESKTVAASGQFSGMRAVWIGLDFSDHWINKLLLLDALHWVSRLAITPTRQRMVNIDIDDVFQSNWADAPRDRTVKIQVEDVSALLDFQKQMEGLFRSGFRFNLGFNSAFYEQQSAEPSFDDAAGDRALVAARAAFRWFDHLPTHESATALDYEALLKQMQISRQWADAHDVTRLIGRYAVPPYHSGVYPTYDPLYRAWRKVWGIEYTATMLDMGFRYNETLVLPRSDCGAPCSSAFYSFSQLSRADTEAIGEHLIASLIAGSPTSFFMSHQSGYARDRLALVAFGKAFATIAAKTTLQLDSAAPEKMGDIYEATIL